jgi:hypothetical protein
MEIRLLYPRLQKTGRKTMKKNLLALMAAALALCIGFDSASASLLGMPLNLRVAIELTDVGAPAVSRQFYSDDVLTGPSLVKAC